MTPKRWLVVVKVVLLPVLIPWFVIRANLEEVLPDLFKELMRLPYDISKEWNNE